MTQTARPDSDVSAGLWAPTPLWARIDEVTPNDIDQVQLFNDSGTFIVGLSDVSDPNIHSLHTIRARVRYTGSEVPTNMVVELKEGTTTRATLVINPTTSFVTYQLVLTSTQAEAIGNYTNLRLAVTGNAAGVGADTVFACSWLEFEVPDVNTPVSPNAFVQFEALLGVSREL